MVGWLIGWTSARQDGGRPPDRPWKALPTLEKTKKCAPLMFLTKEDRVPNIAIVVPAHQEKNNLTCVSSYHFVQSSSRLFVVSAKKKNFQQFQRVLTPRWKLQLLDETIEPEPPVNHLPLMIHSRLPLTTPFSRPQRPSSSSPSQTGTPSGPRTVPHSPPPSTAIANAAVPPTPQ